MSTHRLLRLACVPASLLGVATGCGGLVAADRFGPEASVTTDAGSEASADATVYPLGFSIAPDDAVLVYDLTTATGPLLPYRATEVGADGVAHEVTASTTFSLTGLPLGTFAGATFIAATPAAATVGVSTTHVAATAPVGSATTPLSIVRMHATATPSAPAESLVVSRAAEAAAPARTVLAFQAGGRPLDVALVVDSTGSMVSEIQGLNDALRTTLIARLRAIDPELGIGVLDFKDTDEGCGPDPYVVQVDAPIDQKVATLDLGSLSVAGGCDTPEADLSAMAFALTGAADVSLTPAIVAHVSPAGRFGGMDFRADATPVIVLISDASWHEPSGTATTPQVAQLFKDKGAFFVSIVIDTSGGVDSSATQSLKLAIDTGSTVSPSFLGGSCPTPGGPAGSCPLIFNANASGADIADDIVKAVGAIVRGAGSVSSASLVLSNDPSNGAVDATTFVQRVRAMDEGSSADGCAPHGAIDTNGDGVKETFTAMTTPTKICFELTPRTNTFVAAAPSAVLYKAYATLTAEPSGLPTPQRDTLLFVVPPPR